MYAGHAAISSCHRRRWNGGPILAWLCIKGMLKHLQVRFRNRSRAMHGCHFAMKGAAWERLRKATFWFDWLPRVYFDIDVWSEKSTCIIMRWSWFAGCFFQLCRTSQICTVGLAHLMQSDRLSSRGTKPRNHPWIQYSDVEVKTLCPEQKS